MPEQTKELWGLDGDDTIFIPTESDGSEIVVLKGEKVDKYGDFDIQIQLRGDNYPPNYTPSHPDVFKDLHLKLNSSQSDGEKLFRIINNVYEGKDPNKFLSELQSLSFSKEGFPADVTVSLIQLMMIEQEINYGPGGEWTRFNPPRDLFMSCIRWIFSGEYETLDEVISAGYNGRVDEKYQFSGESIWTRPEL